LVSLPIVQDTFQHLRDSGMLPAASNGFLPGEITRQELAKALGNLLAPETNPRTTPSFDDVMPYATPWTVAAIRMSTPIKYQFVEIGKNPQQLTPEQKQLFWLKFQKGIEDEAQKTLQMANDGINELAPRQQEVEKLLQSAAIPGSFASVPLPSSQDAGKLLSEGLHAVTQMVRSTDRQASTNVSLPVVSQNKQSVTIQSGTTTEAADAILRALNYKNAP
jgi:hypothetical protein